MDWTNLILQVPIVAAFIWFAVQMQKNFLEALDRRDDEYSERNEALCRALNATATQVMELTKHLIEHDGKVEHRIHAAQAETNSMISAALGRKTTPRKPAQ